MVRFSSELALFEVDPTLPEQGYRPLRRTNPTINACLGYYPLPHLGVEIEGALVPTKLDDGEQSELEDPLTSYAARGQIVAQLGKWSVVPFVAAGVGVFGVHSKHGALGKDIDPTLHYGGGVKAHLNRWLTLRVQVRDHVSHEHEMAEAPEPM